MEDIRVLGCLARAEYRDLRGDHWSRAFSRIGLYLGQGERVEELDALADNREKIASFVPAAIEALVSIMKNPGRNSIARLHAAKEILDRGGLPPVQRTEVTGANGSKLTVEVTWIEPNSKNTK